MMGFRRRGIHELQLEEKARGQETKKRRESLYSNQMEVQGEINPPLIDRVLQTTGMGDRLRVKQFTDGIPIAGAWASREATPYADNSRRQIWALGSFWRIRRVE